MNEQLTIIHLIRIAKAYQGFVHWQVSSRISLASLFLDARITRAIRDKVSKLIEDGKLMDYDYLLPKL